MSLLEVITKASANPSPVTSLSNYPIIFNPDPILLNLKPQNEGSNDTSLVKRVDGWQIWGTDSEIIELGQKFFKKLNRKLKNPNKFDKDEFFGMLNSYLEQNRSKVGISVGVIPSDKGYTHKLIEKLGFVMGREVVGLVLEACIVLELWELLEALIVNGLVEHSCSSNLVYNLIEKRRSDLMLTVVMAIVRKEWESQALCAIETATDTGLSGKILSLAKEASVLLMEMKSLIRYLGKWLKKYERFPQAGPCPKASSTLSLKACEWVPTLVDIVKCLGLVMDEHFSSLVLHPEFHEELRSVVGVVNSLALEARISCSIANVIENLRTEVKG
ncbi:hypothetical protein F0562_024930 [Nyssa sinensis]|uniref:Uncharacterized protein n=1 Tax=Nyssa sinensis TaxID=561372 RepID=A0A5J5BGE7_9ASTE|nr:hypothetical protein F0562_024930 [Nyssa sinensis]